MQKNSMSALSERIRTEKKKDQEHIQVEIQLELEQLVEGLRNGFVAELSTTKTAIGGHLVEITKLASDTQQALIDDLVEIGLASEKNRKAALNSIRWGWLKYGLPALSVLVIILGANWGLMQWQSSQIIAKQQQIKQARETLNNLPQGVRFVADGQGKSFLIYEKKPETFETQSGEWATGLNN
jgi:hypothetical protein